MFVKIFTVYDSKAEAYMPPFYMQSTGQALRSFEDTVNDPAHAFNKHPEDYTLFELGKFEDGTALMQMHESKIALSTAIELISHNTPPLTQVK